jgi:L-lactate dehydrogenase
MGTRVGIIGMGWVGSSTALSVLHAGIATELWLDDARPGLAEGEAMDLLHGGSFYPACRVRTATVEEMRDCDAVVIAAGRGGRPDESRLALLRDTAAIARELGRRLAGARSLLVVVTNPVDVLTRVVKEASGLPAERVIGTGTLLDTARLRQVVGARLEVDPRSVHALVVGEHGDSEVALWSSARLGGQLLRAHPGWRRDDEAALGEAVRRAAYEIIRRKGATNHAIGLCTQMLLRVALRDERRILTVSRVQDDLLGAGGVAISLPVVVGAGGATRVLPPELDEAERAAFARSVAVLREAGASV